MRPREGPVIRLGDLVKIQATLPARCIHELSVKELDYQRQRV